MAGGNQLAKYKRGRGFELGTTKNESSKSTERDSNSEPPDDESEELSTRPCCPAGSYIYQGSKLYLACGKDGQDTLIFLSYFVRSLWFIGVTWLPHVLASEDCYSKIFRVRGKL